MVRVAVVGSVNKDLVLVVEQPLTSHVKTRARHGAWCLGGSATNTALWLADAGVSVSLFSVVGDDEEGRWCLDQLALHGGLDASHVAIGRGSTGTAVCITSPTEKLIVTHRERKEILSDRTLPEKGEFSHVHFATRDDDEFAVEFLRQVVGTCSISVELNGRLSSAFLPHASIAFGNADELSAIGLTTDRLSENEISGLLPRDGAQLVVTNSANGAMSISASERVTVRPPFAVDVLDRTGGGDAFDAGFLAAWLWEATTRASLESGLRFAGRAISKLGGCP